jgi:hypothetical protein
VRRSRLSAPLRGKLGITGEEVEQIFIGPDEEIERLFYGDDYDLTVEASEKAHAQLRKEGGKQ